MLIAERTFSHVCKLDCAFRACIHEPVAALRVEFGGRDDLCQLLHIGWLDVDDVETLVLNIQIPQVDAQVVTADVSLTVAIDGDAVDMIRVCIGIGPPWDRRDDRIVMCQAWEFQVGCILEV
jgi:hypothetical protein